MGKVVLGLVIAGLYIWFLYRCFGAGKRADGEEKNDV